MSTVTKEMIEVATKVLVESGKLYNKDYDNETGAEDVVEDMLRAALRCGSHRRMPVPPYAAMKKICPLCGEIMDGLMPQSGYAGLGWFHRWCAENVTRLCTSQEQYKDAIEAAVLKRGFGFNIEADSPEMCFLNILARKA